ncbi:hypothetical protein HPB50_013934 [Hyalomma asiaticum]|uniref:Uncharacterized protein n=1 Tax=Hyalomma asiaticum TaxID=266040 RepID=A0ACB7SF02_HYAAI|nr:hypothetical protein HPB50_013934 [Hyalomma asiaticum]
MSANPWQEEDVRRIEHLLELSFESATLTTPPGLCEPKTFRVTRGLMSGLHSTSAVGSCWNSVLGEMSHSIANHLRGGDQEVRTWKMDRLIGWAAASLKEDPPLEHRQCLFEESARWGQASTPEPEPELLNLTTHNPGNTTNRRCVQPREDGGSAPGATNDLQSPSTSREQGQLWHEWSTWTRRLAPIAL